MRRLPPRPPLLARTGNRLQNEISSIAKSHDPRAEAARRYAAARGARWFEPVIAALRGLSGPGERCMFCSGSESSQVEHFWPKRDFPLRAMEWQNFLWVCGICNLNKGDRFPQAPQVIDPLTENVWEFCFIDEYGNLSAFWRVDVNDVDPRGDITIKTIGLDRDALQQARQSRLEDLKRQINDTLILFNAGTLNVGNLQHRLANWISQPFQPDVADYFLRGPGRSEQPFAAFLAAVEPNAA
jgi:hypothetical protein